MTGKSSCPTTCVFKKNGCYAEGGPIAIHWNKVDDSGITINELCQQIKKLPRRILWRHNTAGDLVHNDGMIDRNHINKIVQANRGRHGFTYTHHELNEHNIDVIRYANDNGFTVNISLDSITQIKEKQHLGLPMVCVLPIDAPKVQEVDGTKVVVCPAQSIEETETREAPTCLTCELCQKRDRDYVIGFRAHGRGFKKVNLIAKG